MISIEQLTEAKQEDLSALNAVVLQLRSDPSKHEPITLKRLEAILADTSKVLLVIRDDGKIVGTGTLNWANFLTGTDGDIDDVVVDETYRGQGLGEKLVQALIAAARARGVDSIYLTSRPSRIAANKLYQKLGFVQKETNCYQMDL